MEYAPEHVCRSAIERLKAGDAEDLGLIAHQIAVSLARKWRWPPGCEVEDAVQEAVLTLMLKAAGYDADRGKAFNYITTIIKHSFCKTSKAARRSTHLPLDFLDLLGVRP